LIPYCFQGEGALAIGTQVSAKYKGAFCEAKVRSVDKQVKTSISYLKKHILLAYLKGLTLPKDLRQRGTFGGP
jgi:hypothetical protein